MQAGDSGRQRQIVLAWLRSGQSEHNAAAAGVPAATLEQWRDAYFQSKLPPLAGDVSAAVNAAVSIRRDEWGVAHIRASSASDVFFGLGYAMAQDRLWQLDYQRRLASGRLAEVLGPRSLASDLVMRTLGMAAAGERGWLLASEEERRLLESFTAGINHWRQTAISATPPLLPVEYELLEYEPAPWQPVDAIAVWKHRWWLLTGRLEPVVVDDVARRILPPELAAAYFQGEAADETIVPELPSTSTLGEIPGSGADEGSNNWAVAGSRSTTGSPVLCGDPHNAFGLPSQWFEVQLTCPEFDAAGAVYVGTPFLYFGRNSEVAWAVTNHSVSIRDLYREASHPTDPALYREGQGWRPFEEERHAIAVGGAGTEELTVRRTVRGPVVNELLPLRGQTVAGAREAPISLRWYGAEAESGLAASLALLRARSADDVLAALRHWPCPPLNYVYADRAGHIGYHVAGHVPMRGVSGSAIRDANDPNARWDGIVPFDVLPQERDPERGWVASANNVPGLRDPWYLSLGHWSDGYRYRRIRTRLSAREQLTPAEVSAIQADVVSGRAEELRSVVLAHLQPLAETGQQAVPALAVRVLQRWDGAFTVDSVGATIWAAFWQDWTEAVARARFPTDLAELVASEVGGVANHLLRHPSVPWSPQEATADVVRRAFRSAVERLAAASGPDPTTWLWGSLHTLEHAHPLAERFGLRSLYNVGPSPTSGGPTVRAAGYRRGPPFPVLSGATYRHVSDLSRPDKLDTIQTAGQSAQLGSPHYADQAPLWLADQFHPLHMSEADVAAHTIGETRLLPVC